VRSSEEKLHASTISSLGSASVEKETQKVLFVLRSNSRTGRCIKNSKEFSINVLTNTQSQLATLFSKEFTPAEIEQHIIYKKEIPILEGALFTLICTLDSIVRVDSNEVIIAKVEFASYQESSSKPLIYRNREYS
jgi:flavin reductase (DIM6/NTAB) family NADH-FMN oxidoreductase RutF